MFYLELGLLMLRKRALPHNASPGFADERRYRDSAEMLGGLRGVVIVRSRDAGRVSRGQHVVVDHVQGETVSIVSSLPSCSYSAMSGGRCGTTCSRCDNTRLRVYCKKSQSRRGRRVARPEYRQLEKDSRPNLGLANPVLPRRTEPLPSCGRRSAIDYSRQPID